MSFQSFFIPTHLIAEKWFWISAAKLITAKKYQVSSLGQTLKKVTIENFLKHEINKRVKINQIYNHCNEQIIQFRANWTQDENV